MQRRKWWSSHINAAFVTHDRQPLPITKKKSFSPRFLPQGGLFLSNYLISALDDSWITKFFTPWLTMMVVSSEHTQREHGLEKQHSFPAVVSWLCTMYIGGFNCWQITYIAPLPTKTSSVWIPGGSLVSMQTFLCLHCFRRPFSAFKTQEGKEHQPSDCSRGLSGWMK